MLADVTVLPDPWGLTPQQSRVMDAICTHGCQKLAARELGISIRTIEHHSSHAGKRMGQRTTIGKYLAWDRWMRSRDPNAGNKGPADRPVPLG